MAKNISERKLNKLLELNKKLTLEDNFSKKIELISNAIKEILKVDRCTIFIHDKETKTFWSVYSDTDNYIEMPDIKGIASEVYKTKKSIIINDVKNSSIFNSDIDKGSGYRTKAVLAMPIMGYAQRVLGVIQLTNKIDGSEVFSEDDERVLNYIINHISPFLEIMLQGEK